MAYAGLFFFFSALQDSSAIGYILKTYGPMGRELDALLSRESRVGGTGTEEEVGTRTSRRGMSQLWEGRARLDQVPGLEPEPSAKSPVF